MEIAIIACDQKKELMTQFCIAYCGILSKHNIYATEITGRYISEATGLKIERMMQDHRAVRSRSLQESLSMKLTSFFTSEIPPVRPFSTRTSTTF